MEIENKKNWIRIELKKINKNNNELDENQDKWSIYHKSYAVAIAIAIAHKCKWTSRRKLFAASENWYWQKSSARVNESKYKCKCTQRDEHTHPRIKSEKIIIIIIIAKTTKIESNRIETKRANVQIIFRPISGFVHRTGRNFDKWPLHVYICAIFATESLRISVSHVN